MVTHSEQNPNRLFLEGTREAAGSRGGRAGEVMLLGDLWLPNRPESAAAARRFAASVAVGWDLVHLVDTVQLLLSELVGNATRHAADPADPPGSRLRLLMLREGDRLRAEVHDPSRCLPRLRHAGENDESGRGYFLVVTLADEVGTYLTADGKAVWFSLPAWSGNLAA
jgi:anti-sigma regulatory factor (Ser/Thr protein kinase)